MISSRYLPYMNFERGQYLSYSFDLRRNNDNGCKSNDIWEFNSTAMKDLILSSLSLPEMINERKGLVIVIDLDSYNDENADSLAAILIK